MEHKATLPTSFRLPHKQPEPPVQLREHGRALWISLTGEYDLSDSGALAHLTSACRAEDVIVEMLAKVKRQGYVIEGKPHPLLSAIGRAEQTKRQALRSLNLDLEPLSRPRRPGAIA